MFVPFLRDGDIAAPLSLYLAFRPRCATAKYQKKEPLK